MPPDDPTDTPTVLIVATDAVVAALLGTLLELDGYAPLFPEPGEPPVSALGRLEPRVVLVDCDEPGACANGFFAECAVQGTTVVLFSPARMPYDVREVAERYGLPAFSFPIDRTRLGQVIAEAMLVLLLYLRPA